MPNEMMSAMRVELDAELAGGAGQPRDAAVEHVEHDREADERRRGLVLAAHRVDDAGVAAEHVAHREQAGQQVDAAAEPVAAGDPSPAAGTAAGPSCLLESRWPAELDRERQRMRAVSVAPR